MGFWDDDEETEEMVTVEIPKRCLTEHISQEAKDAIKEIEWRCSREITLQEERHKRTIEQLQRVHVADMEQINLREKWHLKEIEWYRENAPVKYHLL